jgi:hypothetical protein
MAYEKEKDVEKFAETISFGETEITVGVYSYDEGAPKLGISRENIKEDGSKAFSKLGRMTKDEVEKVVPVIQKALEQM